MVSDQMPQPEHDGEVEGSFGFELLVWGRHSVMSHCPCLFLFSICVFKVD